MTCGTTPAIILTAETGGEASWAPLLLGADTATDGAAADAGTESLFAAAAPGALLVARAPSFLPVVRTEARTFAFFNPASEKLSRKLIYRKCSHTVQ